MRTNIICNVCDCSISRGNMPTHIKTKKCINIEKIFKVNIYMYIYIYI